MKSLNKITHFQYIHTYIYIYQEQPKPWKNGLQDGDQENVGFDQWWVENPGFDSGIAK